MKFHCERCNTPYRIADERVRGKTLKIRCKSCSAVITVNDEDSASAAPADAAWFVSILGVQHGPYSAQAARAWIAERLGQGPMYCWREGFTDWKPVTEVAELAPPAPPVAAPPAKAAGAAAPSAMGLARAAGIAASASPAGGQEKAAGATAVTPPSASVASVASVASMVRDPAPSPAAVKPAGAPEPKADFSLTDLFPEALDGEDLVEEEEDAAATLLAVPRQPTTPPPVGFAGAQPGARASSSGSSSSGDGENRTLLGPSALSPSRPAGAVPLPLGAPKPTAITPSVTVPPSAAVPAPTPGPAGPSLVSRLSERMNAAEDLDLAISEPSRVVVLKDLAPPGQPSAAPAQSAWPAATGKGTGSVPAFLGTGPAAAVGDNILVRPPTVTDEPSARRRRSLAPLIGLAVAAVVAVVAILVIWQSSDDSDGRSVAGRRAPSDYENLGFQLNDPRRSADPEDKAGSTTTAGSQTRASGSGSGTTRTPRDRIDSNPRPPDRGELVPTNPGQTGQGEGGEGANTPLSPDEIIRQSDRSQMAYTRCYERAKRKDPFLSVRSLDVSITVSSAGAVTDVRTSTHGDHLLGQCLTSMIKTWKFRPSSEGIRTEISLKFER